MPERRRTSLDGEGAECQSRRVEPLWAFGLAGLGVLDESSTCRRSNRRCAPLSTGDLHLAWASVQECHPAGATSAGGGPVRSVERGHRDIACRDGWRQGMVTCPASIRRFSPRGTDAV
jgi:hypothetical protein